MSKHPPDEAAHRRLTLRSRLRDPRLISWPTFFISSALLSFEIAQYGFADFALAQIVVFAFLASARWLYLSRTFATRHTWVMITTIVVASLGGSITAQLLLADPNTAVGADGAFTRMIAIPAAGLLSVSLIDYRDNVRALRATARQLQATRDAGLASLVAAREEMTARVQASLASTLDELSSSEALVGAADLAALAQDTVRPLSHEFASSTPVFTPISAQPSRLSWASVLNDVAARPLIIPWLMGLAVAVMSIRFTFAQTDVAVGSTITSIGPLTLSVDGAALLTSLAFLVIVFVSVWALAAVTVRVTRPLLARLSGGARWWIVAASVVGIGLGLQAVLLVVPFVPGPLASITTDPVGRFWAFAPVVVIALVLAIARTASLARASTLHELEAVNSELTWEIARVRLDLWAQQRRFALAIHGPLQAAITASAVLLASADPRQRDEVVRDAHERIKSALAHVTENRDAVVDVHLGLAEIRGTWQGVCEVFVDVESDAESLLAFDATCRQALVMVIGESIANAAIHGKATFANVKIGVDRGRFIRVTIHDDGSGLDALSQAGLGSSLLDEACGEWELIDTGGGARLTALLATSLVGEALTHS